jgi:putative FmdB family regulatory protein
MPLFEYRCTQCGHQFEELLLGTATPACPICQSQQLDKLLSTFAVSSGNSAPRDTVAPCATCGDPRGPGACALD